MRKKHSKISGRSREKIESKYEQHNTYQKSNYEKEVLFINSSKLSTSRSFSMSIT